VQDLQLLKFFKNVSEVSSLFHTFIRNRGQGEVFGTRAS